MPWLNLSSYIVYCMLNYCIGCKFPILHIVATAHTGQYQVLDKYFEIHRRDLSDSGFILVRELALEL